MFVSFLNFLNMPLERPIYKASMTCRLQTEIFLYGKEDRKAIPCQTIQYHPRYSRPWPLQCLKNQTTTPTQRPGL